MDIFVDRIKRKSDFYNLTKHRNVPFFSKKIEASSPLAKFIQMCYSESMILRHTLISDIEARCLKMVDKKLNKIICKAFKEALEGNPTLLASMHLDNNGLDDELLSTILVNINEW